MVTKVTPVPPRRSTRVTNPPQRLREVTPEAENLQAKTAASTTLPNIPEIVQGVAANSDIMAESPPPSNTLPEPDISDSESQSSSSQCRRHSSDNYTRKVLNRLLFNLFFVPIVFLYLTLRFIVTKGIVLQMA